MSFFSLLYFLFVGGFDFGFCLWGEKKKKKKKNTRQKKRKKKKGHISSTSSIKKNINKPNRYLTKNTFVLCVETLTVLLWGPGCFLVAALILQRSPWRYPLQIIVSMGQLYGDALYYATSFFDHAVNGISYSRPEAVYFWFYFVGCNAVSFLLLFLFFPFSFFKKEKQSNPEVEKEKEEEEEKKKKENGM